MKVIEKHPIIMIVIGIIGISLSSIFVKYSEAPSAVTAAYRLIITVILLTPAALGRKETRNEILSMTKKTLLLSALSGFMLALHFYLWFESLSHTSVASSTTIVCTEVIWVSLGFCLLMKGRISKKAVLAILITLIGSVMIALSDSKNETNMIYGDILALLAAVAVAGYTLIGRLVRKNASTTAYTYVVYIVCAAVLVCTSSVQGHKLFSYGLSPVIVGLLLAVFSTLLGHSIFSWCLKFFSPSFVSASKLLEPVVAAAFAAVLFSEIPAPLQLIGGALILAGVVYYSRIEMKSEQK
ncbi:MAG: DMT family transporter [Clostridia bacterium]|nr:DMT family transporter [Clostridia bacterium]